jgi:6-phosphogluconolactonase (cycloisomerase 2 family)
MVKEVIKLFSDLTLNRVLFLLGGKMRNIRRKSKWIVATLVIASVFPLARASAWEDGNTAPTKTLDADADLSIIVTDAAFDLAGNLYVLNLEQNHRYAVNVYAAGYLYGHPVPVKHVVVNRAGVGVLTSIDLDSNGNVYVSTYPVSGILVYDDISTWVSDGSTQPIKTLSYDFPKAISLDSTDNLYVVDSAKVSVYDDISTWQQNGSTQPTKVLTGGNTGLDTAASVALDNSDNMYVSNGGNNSITYYTVGWSDGNTSPTKTLIGNNTGLDSPGSIAFDASGKMFVASGCFTCPDISGSPKVLAFATNWLSGNTAPIKTLIGNRTRLKGGINLAFERSGAMFATGGSADSGRVIQFAANWASGNMAPVSILDSLAATGIAFDQMGRMYVADQPRDSILVYAANWADDQAQPIKILSGANTGLSSPFDISFDNVGNMYVANSQGYGYGGIPNSVTVYASDWASGDTAPIKTLFGNATGLIDPVNVSFDTRNNMYVLNYSNSSVTMYAAGWASGNTAPVKTLIGNNTGLNYPLDSAFDSADNLYVVNDSGNRINVFASNWTDGNSAPIATLHGPATGLDTPESLAIGSNGKIYVSNVRGDSVTVYGDFTTWAADGNTAPLKTLSGADTGLDGPWGIAFDANGNMYVANGETVTMYAGEIPPPVTTTTTIPATTTIPPTTLPPAPEVFVLPATL